jgi:SAM-dependent methyltransferase
MKNPRDVISLNKRAWDRVADRYDRRADVRVGALFNAFMAALPHGGRVLDAGAGTGLPYALSLVERGFRVVGVDVSSRMVEIARGNVPVAEFHELSMTEMEFEDEFDGALSVFSMLLLDPDGFRAAAERIARSLRQGGYLYIVLNEPREEGADVDGEAVVEIMGEEMYSRAYTVEEVRGALAPFGMKVREFHRESWWTAEFGEEHVTEFLFEKT